MDAQNKRSGKNSMESVHEAGRESVVRKICERGAGSENKNSSGDEIPTKRELLCSAPGKLPEFAEMTQITAITPFKVIQGHRLWYQSKVHIRFPVSD